MHRQHSFGKRDKCVKLTLTDWAYGYTIYIFNITDGPISSVT